MSDISFSKYLLLGALTFVFVGLLTPIMRKIAISVGAVDAPNLERKVQKEPVPYLGGVAIAIGVVGASYAALLAEDFTMENFRLASFVLVPAIAISVMGLIDDLKGLQPWPRLGSLTPRPRARGATAGRAPGPVGGAVAGPWLQHVWLPGVGLRASKAQPPIFY